MQITKKDFRILGDAVRHGRKDKKLTQAQLAKAADCAVRTIQSIENENRNTLPPLEFLLKLGGILGLTLEDMLPCLAGEFHRISDPLDCLFDLEALEVSPTSEPRLMA